MGQTVGNNNQQNIYTLQSAVEKYNSGKYKEAETILEQLVLSEKEEFLPEIRLLDMKIKYRLNDYTVSKEIGKSFLMEYPESEFKNEVLVTFGDIFMAEGSFDAAFRTFLNALKNSFEKQNQKYIIDRIFILLQYGISPNIIEEMLATEIDTEIIQILLLAKAHTEMQTGQLGKSANTISEIDINILSKIIDDYYSKLFTQIKSMTTGRTIVAVVLPLTGKDAKVGKEFLDGLKYAELNNSAINTELSLIIYDNAGDELKTLEIFQALSKNPNIVAVIGPISEKNSIIAGCNAENIGIPIIFPAVTIDGLAHISDNIFFMNSDLNTRGNLAAKFIVETLEAENIAVLAPADKFGQSLVDAFTEKLSTYNQTPQIIEWYSGVPMNLSRQFKSIRTKAWELTETDKSWFASKIKRNTKFDNEMTAEDSSEIVLSSIDVIYMPIHDGHLDYIGAQFPVYNIDAVVVGNDSWADLEVLRKENIGPHFKDSYVISNYNYFNIDLLNNNFNAKHMGYFYQAIDCYNLLAKSITDACVSNISLKQQLSNLYDFNGIFGTYDFTDGDTNVNSTLNIMRFDGYNFDKYIYPDQPFQY